MKTKNVHARWCLALLTAAAMTATVAEAGDNVPGSAGFAPTVQVAGSALVLNGSGTRFKAVFRVYDAALYVGQRVSTGEQFFALGGPKALQLVARRDLGSAELGRMLVRGISEANRPQDVMRQLVGMSQMGEMFASRRQISSGESFGFEFRPGVGTLLLLNGKAVGAPITEPGFFDLVMRMWLGANPVDARLKADLLGQRVPEGAAFQAP